MTDPALDMVDQLGASASGAAFEDVQNTKAVILAGGRGTRLAPFTSVLPKPLMPVGNRAILEIVVRRLADCGITDVTFCVGYLSHLIRAVFDGGAANGNHYGPTSIKYVQEQEAMGTAAPLALVDGLNDTFIVMNGDVLTTLDYRSLLGHHRSAGNVLTIATHLRTTKIDYGILHVDAGSRIQAFEEKPEILSSVSMGIYAMEPVILEYLPPGQAFDFPDLVRALLDDDQPVGAFLYDGLWFDIGRHEEYERAVTAWEDLERDEARAAQSDPDRAPVRAVE
ncbi:MAG TPA: sugar phosphate nucleotidyltransferase [Gaiellaceae bacterium]|nr:sugar phosphate nucleotidyltransferase [Gaiellaceae bacterium]